MRFALKNQAKIESALTRAVLDDIVESMKSYAQHHDKPEQSDLGETMVKEVSYKTISINSTRSSGKRIEFYIVGRMFDVYSLSLKHYPS